MSIKFKKTEFKGNAKTATILFSGNKKKSGLLSKLGTLPKIENKESLFAYNQKELNGASAFVFGLDPKKETLTCERMREIGGAFYKAAKSSKVSTLAFSWEEFENLGGETTELMKGAAEGALLSDYSMQEGKSKTQKTPTLTVEVFASDSKTLTAVKKVLKESEAMVGAVHFARRLGDLPGNMMTPSLLAKNAQSLNPQGLR